MPKTMRVCLTGGGTAGHVTPHFALLPVMAERGYDVFYVGSNGIESQLVAEQGIRFHAIPAGKLRRYFSLKNFLDVFKVGFGVIWSLVLLLRHRPSVVFSKGGFVSVPVAIAAWLLRIPVISHESDMTPGLATRIVARFAHKILYTFPETGKYLPASSENVGTPIRPELFKGSAQRGLHLCGFVAEDVPTILVMGGSQGAQKINQEVEVALPELLKVYRVVHLTGKGKSLDFKHSRYFGLEYAKDELKDLLALADVVVSRAGANSIFELLALRKPMLLIPLVVGSRGDQVLNAEAFVAQGWARSVDETKMTAENLCEAIRQVYDDCDKIIAKQNEFAGSDSTGKILSILESFGA